MSATLPPAGPEPPRSAVLLAVALGGAVGSVLRWAVELLIPSGAGWPWATLLANVVGSALLALLVVSRAHRPHPWWLSPGVGVGLLGGFTTFSTYAVQVAVLGQVQPLLAVGYLLATPALCVGAVVLVGALALRRGRHR